MNKNKTETKYPDKIEKVAEQLLKTSNSDCSVVTGVELENSEFF